MLETQGGVGEYGELVPGPPWILGHRGSPRETPENTLVSLRRAVDLGLDGVTYDLRACATGEPVLIHDETLERTTDAGGPVSKLTLPELAAIDAGGWFHKRFAGEPLPLLEEALELPGRVAGELPMHMIEVKDPALVAEVARQIREVPRPLSVRVASFHRSVCLEARDLSLAAMLLSLDANEDDLLFVRDERLAAYGTGPGGWRTPAGEHDWPCERWSWSVDEPNELLASCRAPLFGLNTNEPLRALATRALVHLTPHDEGAYPISVPSLEVSAAQDGGGAHGEWTGRWRVAVEIRNPFPFPVETALTIKVRGGAFEIEGLPVATRLSVGETREIPLTITGGSWSPLEDPLLLGRFVWSRGPGRPKESLILDAPLARVRTLRLAHATERVPMLRERPGEAYASMTVRRRGSEILAWVEDAGGLTDVRSALRLGSAIHWGGQGVRVHLPRAAGGGPKVLPFSLGFLGRRKDEPDGPRLLRRWAGGLPTALRSGAPGRLVLEQRV